MNSIQTCPFCQEASGRSDAWFHSLYPEFSSRRIASHGGVFAIPTIGQLFPGSLMLVADRHVERFAEATDLQEDVMSLLDELLSSVSGFGTPLVYEHGARCGGRSGCGIYHAHLHVVPLPIQPLIAELTGLEGTNAHDLREAWRRAAFGPDYLVVGAGRETILFHSNDGFGSQFMRRRLAASYARDRDWDWRSYRFQEPDVIETLSHFGVTR